MGPQQLSLHNRFVVQDSIYEIANESDPDATWMVTLDDQSEDELRARESLLKTSALVSRSAASSPIELTG